MVNPARDPALVQASDFSFSGLHLPGNTSNPNGSKVTPVSVAQLPGLNTLGISMFVSTMHRGYLTPPLLTQSHLKFLRGGTLFKVGFVTSNPDNSLITKTLQKGDVFVSSGTYSLPAQRGNWKCCCYSCIDQPESWSDHHCKCSFRSKPDVSSDILAKAFQVDKSVVDQTPVKF
ncbi:UNVERIFIED_CONTAM: putative germin-like protein 2-2 [Sesamum angustifolium]|uniref:Germin-like protein 2-2 n=1 Tax=Sesamum angustifolium TaxID=2727405 RepID=A0AAW2PVE3_9LAMI